MPSFPAAFANVAGWRRCKRLRVAVRSSPTAATHRRPSCYPLTIPILIYALQDRFESLSFASNDVLIAGLGLRFSVAVLIPGAKI